MLRRTVLQILATSTLACALLPTALADSMETIRKNGILRIAIPEDFPPFGTVGPDLKPRGYDIDVAGLLAKEMGVALQLVAVTSTNRVPYLTTGKVDLVISSLGKNPDREKVIDFSNAYAPFFNGVFGPGNIKVAAAADLAGKTVGVTRGSVEDLELSKIAPATATIKRFEDNNGTIAAYMSNQVQLVATGNVVAAAINERSKQRPLDTKFLVKNSPCFVGLNKGETALQAKVNEILAASKKNGRLNEISQRWLHAALPTDL